MSLFISCNNGQNSSGSKGQSLEPSRGGQTLNNKYMIENCSKGCEGKEEVAERDHKGDGVLRKAHGEFSQDAFNYKKSREPKWWTQ